MEQAVTIAPVASPSSPRSYPLKWGLRAAALTYLIFMVGTPLFVITVQGFREGLSEFVVNITRPAALSAVWIAVWTAGVMTLINLVMGTLTAWVLVKYRFPGKRLLDSVVDLPFAVPTLVTGVMMMLLYGPQSTVGGFLQESFGLRVLFAPPGIVLAITFISYPFVIRTVQPVLLTLDASLEEAAHTLGASPLTTFRRVILPAILPAMLTGSLLSFARALGEFGSVVLVSGNIPMRTQTAAVYIFGQVESGDMSAASAVSFVLLAIAFTVTVTIDLIQRRSLRYA